jgi:hypothetical protein
VEKKPNRKIYSKSKSHSADQQKILNYFNYIEKQKKHYDKLATDMQADLSQFKAKPEFQEFVRQN